MSEKPSTSGMPELPQIPEPGQVDPTLQPITNEPKTRFGKGKKLSFVAILGIALVVLLGGSAGAYFGIIAPNKPENLLKTAVTKQLQKKQQTTKGTVSLDLKNQDIKNVSVNFNAAIDNEKQAFSTSVEASVSGAKLPLEVRSVDKSLFIKVGDLGSIKGLAGLAGGPQASSIVDGLAKKVSNQWIEVDQSLLKQANAECVTGLMGTFSKKDTDQLVKAYGNNAFFTVKGKSADKVDGKSTTKFELDLNRENLDKFSDSLDQLEAVKKIADCGNQTNKKPSGDKEVAGQAKDALKDTTMKFYVWVDGGKNLRQVQVVANDKDANATVTMTFTDDKVDIQKPAGAKPVLEVLGDFSQLLGGIPVGNLSGQSVQKSGLSKECEAAFQAYISGGGVTAPPTNCL